jgi:acyl-CoA thioester hydrolase
MKTRRRKKTYFPREKNAPSPVSYTVTRRIRFSEVDAMAISWHGRYLQFFEEAAAELGRKIGMGYKDFFEYETQAPIAQIHVDYHKPLVLDELFSITATIIWSDAAKLNTEFVITKEDGRIAATGYSVQLFTNPRTDEVFLFPPPIYEKCRKKWLAGEFDNE